MNEATATWTCDQCGTTHTYDPKEQCLTVNCCGPERYRVGNYFLAVSPGHCQAGYEAPWTDNTQEPQLPCCARCLNTIPSEDYEMFYPRKKWGLLMASSTGLCGVVNDRRGIERYHHCTHFLPGDIAPTL